MLNSSFINIPLMQDQDIIDIKCPILINEPVEVNGQSKEGCDAEILERCRYFPTSAMYNRQSNF